MTKVKTQDVSEPSMDRILRVTVGKPPKQINGPISLMEYDPNWPKLFSREAVLIRNALCERALRIEHVGSTSVPSLVAKPIIDIMLAVADSANEQSYVPPLEDLGYVLRIREPEWHEHRMLRRELEQDMMINLHVFTEGDSEIGRMLAFRDWLRNNPEDRERYAETKRKLATQNWRYVQDYADAKSKVVESIIARSHRTARI